MRILVLPKLVFDDGAFLGSDGEVKATSVHIEVHSDHIIASLDQPRTRSGARLPPIDRFSISVGCRLLSGIL